jgi:hypothetical protein
LNIGRVALEWHARSNQNQFQRRPCLKIITLSSRVLIKESRTWVLAAIDARNTEQKRYNASFAPKTEDKAELTKARKVVRRAVEEAKEALALQLVGEINDRQSADDRRELTPKEEGQVTRALQKGPRVVVEITPMYLRQDQATVTSDMCET